MKVHLLRTKDVGIDIYNDVLNLARSFKGPIFFESNEEDQLIDHVTSRHVVEKDEFEKQKELSRVSVYSAMHSSYIPYEFPFEEPQAKWEDFFDLCRAFRNANAINNNEVIILLTATANDKNWFGAVDEDMKNIFIQTSHWNHFFGSSVDARFPICYEIAAWLLRLQMFQQRNEIVNGGFNTETVVLVACVHNHRIVTRGPLNIFLFKIAPPFSICTGNGRDGG